MSQHLVGFLCAFDPGSGQEPILSIFFTAKEFLPQGIQLSHPIEKNN